MKYYYFLDETGDHGLSFIDKNFPIFLLCGMFISENELNTIIEKATQIKKKYFKSKEVVFHSREIRKCEGPFQVLFDIDLKQKFYTDINQFMSRSEYIIISSGIQKEKYIKQYGKGARNPYLISTSFIMERLIFAADKKGDLSDIEIIIESRGRREDKQLLAYLNNILDKGTFYVKSERFKKIIKRIHFKHKIDNDIGLQVTDLIAYPIARYLLKPKVLNPSFEIIKNKIYTNDKGKFIGWGVKLFP